MSQPSVVCLRLRSTSIRIVGVRSAGVGIAGVRSTGVRRRSSKARQKQASLLVTLMHAHAHPPAHMCTHTCTCTHARMHAPTHPPTHTPTHTVETHEGGNKVKEYNPEVDQSPNPSFIGEMHEFTQQLYPAFLEEQLKLGLETLNLEGE